MMNYFGLFNTLLWDWLSIPVCYWKLLRFKHERSGKSSQ